MSGAAEKGYQVAARAGRWSVMLRRLLRLPKAHRSVPLRSLQRYARANAALRPVPVRAPRAR
jgi:hypothetical protein